MTSTAVRPADRTLRVLLFVVRAGLALVFAGAGAAKLAGDSAMVDTFADVGAGQWLRFVVGAAEVAGAVGLWVPRLRVAAALGLAALMVGATVANVALLDASPVLTLVLLALLLGLARLTKA